MADRMGSSQDLDVSLPDSEIPCQRINTRTDLIREKQRQLRFLKGPIPLQWIRENIQSPADRLLLVLRAYSDMQRGGPIKLTAGIEADAGMPNRKATYRSLQKLESKAIISVERASGRKPLVSLR